MNNKSLAVLGASYMAGVFLDKAKTMGYKTYCFAWEDGAVAKEQADAFFPISVMERDIICQKCRELKVDGVISTTEAPIATCGYITSRLNLVGNSIETSESITNKEWVRNRASLCRLIKQPKYILMKNINDTISFEECAFPVILKPVCGGGKKGVIVCEEYKNLDNSIKYAFEYDSKKKGIMIEEFISAGKEYSVECLSYKGKHELIQITEKISSGPPNCVELGHHQPALLSCYMQKKVNEAINELLDSVAFENGPTHTEIKVVGEDVFLIELNARPGGDHIATKLIELSTGYDYIGNSVRVALGIQPDALDRSINRYSGVYFVTKQTERLKELFDRCDTEEWLYEKHVENDNLSVLTHNDCIHTNYMIYSSDNRIDL